MCSNRWANPDVLCAHYERQRHRRWLRLLPAQNGLPTIITRKPLARVKSCVIGISGLCKQICRQRQNRRLPFEPAWAATARTSTASELKATSLNFLIFLIVLIFAPFLTLRMTKRLPPLRLTECRHPTQILSGAPICFNTMYELRASTAPKTATMAFIPTNGIAYRDFNCRLAVKHNRTSQVPLQTSGYTVIC